MTAPVPVYFGDAIVTSGTTMIRTASVSQVIAGVWIDWGEQRWFTDQAVADIPELQPLIAAVRRTRCHCTRWACRKWYTDTGDSRLGWTGYCPTCVGSLVAGCEQIYGRLPTDTERFCPACDAIVDQDYWAMPEADGRQRNRCLACWRDFVRAKNARARDRQDRMAS